MKRPTFKIIMRTDVKNKSGKYPLYLIFTNERVKKYTSLNIAIDKANWNEAKQIVKKAEPDSYRINNILQSYTKRANDIIYHFTIQNKPLSSDEFKRQILNDLQNTGSFFGFIENEITVYGAKYSAFTIKYYKSQITKLKRFREELSFNQIDIRFIKEYENFMFSELENHPNTVTKTLSWMRSVIEKAIISGVLERNPFENQKFSYLASNREKLSIKELDQLEELIERKVLTGGMNEVAKAFLFSCYTGLRFSDMVELRFKHIQGNFIDLVMHKTKLSVRIPLIDRAKRHLPKDNGLSNQKVFRMFTNQVTNRHLKEVCKEAKINKSVSFHCARHTFATCGIDLGMNIEIISNMLGHTDIKTTKIYVKYSDGAKVRQIEKWNELA
jgi:site-specific recombinase XerD